MKKLLKSLVLLSVIFVSCNSSNKIENEGSINENKTVEYANDLTENLHRDFTNLSVSEAQDCFNRSSLIGRVIIHNNGRTLNISSDGILTYQLFGTDYSPDALQSRFGNVYDVERRNINVEIDDTLEVVTILSYKNSFLKIYYNAELSRTDIAAGRIKDEEIVLVSAMHIGITKEVFFDNLLLNSSQYDFGKIDTVKNGNEMGEVQQIFVFSGNSLSEIILKSNYEWIPFEL